MFISNDAVMDTIEALGEEGIVQLTDMNPGISPFQRPFAHDIARLVERYFTADVILRYYFSSDVMKWSASCDTSRATPTR